MRGKEVGKEMGESRQLEKGTVGHDKIEAQDMGFQETRSLCCVQKNRTVSSRFRGANEALRRFRVQPNRHNGLMRPE